MVPKRKVEPPQFRELREKAGLTIQGAADLIGVELPTAGRYERGETLPTRLALDILRRAGRRPLSREPASLSFRFIDLFAGIGGLRRGFEPIGGRCVFTSEWDLNCQKTYRANFADSHIIAGDIRPYAQNPELIPEHEVLLAGFPCQPFSIAGVSKKNALGRPHGFLCDTQGTLFFDAAQIIAHHRPAVFVLENVKNLVRHDGGRTFATIMHALTTELGYHVQYRVISSQAWVPQKRERIFIVGFRDATSFDFCKLKVPDPERGPKLGSILEPEVDSKYTLTPKLWSYLKEYKAKHRAAGNGFGFGLVGPDDVTRTLSARYYKDGAEILVSQGKGKRPRRLTPKECARLMGFDSEEHAFHIVVSDAQAYKQFGNAVVVPVARFIAEALKPHIEIAIKRPCVAIGGERVTLTRPDRAEARAVA